ncbi:MAG: hypothetical protein Q7J25_00595 [Vicinamibacterales bacterium]|nr:hypothetical protein [Vicinamibacterales bacterium]
MIRARCLSSLVLVLSGLGLVAMAVARPAASSDATRSANAATSRALALFAHSDECLACHNNLQSPAGEDVSIGLAWRATMMANSARDPYWQASVRRETLDHPSHAAEIQDECGACHMPMSTHAARAGGAHGLVFDHLPVAQHRTRPLDRLAADGVSCTVCHQIGAAQLAQPDGFNGNIRLPPTPADGRRVIFGPYGIDAGRKRIMHSVTGFVQAKGDHLRESELCASCHTLRTQAFGPSGDIVGSLPEQMNYQEWQHSDFNREKRSCQSCHMPRVPGPVRIASSLGDQREGLSQHAFVGGNVMMLRILDRFRVELGTQALPAELTGMAAATERQVRQDTATVQVLAPGVEDGTLTFEVELVNKTGHKFPTGYPARRAWLHVTVRDAQARVVFESGAVRPDGSIAGNRADAEPSSFEPHYDLVRTTDQVPIYETVLGDRAGTPTTGLLAATQYLKDNRLLPRGFDKQTASSDIAVHGGAATDVDFSGGGDRVHYRVPVVEGDRYTIAVELLYQPIAYRWARNLEGVPGTEPERFTAYYNAEAHHSSVVVSSAFATTQP